jgi:hypothetical protein
MDRQPLLAIGRNYPGKALLIRSRLAVQLGRQGAPRPFFFAFRRIGRTFSRPFAEAPLGLKSISFEAKNTLSGATATGQSAQPYCYGLDVAAALFFPLFLLGRSRNLRERGGRRGDLRLLLFWLFGFPVAPNLAFRHCNSPLRRLAGCEHSIIRSAVV